MCLAIPALVSGLDAAADTAEVAIGGVRKTISTSLLDEVAVGDYVLVHVGYALNRIDAAEAEATLQLMRDAGVGTDAPFDLAAAP